MSILKEPQPGFVITVPILLLLWEKREKMSEKFLQKMISRCSDFDIAFKTGAVNGYTGLNILICEMMER